MKFFNTAGPIKPEIHYNIPLVERINSDEIIHLIDQQKYFVLHAPRQSGKTSSLLQLMKILNDSGKYKCLYINVESAQAARENVEEAMKAIISSLASNERFYLKEKVFAEYKDEIFSEGVFSALKKALELWTLESEIPTVLFIDEIDSLVGDSLISVLRQLRSGYTQRPAGFPQSIILCGVRDVRDYRINSSREKDVITGGSCFNINSKSLVVGNLKQEDVESLYLQHTEETGQVFTKEAIKLAFEYTNGQPWLANALAYEVCYEMKEGKDRKNEITADMIVTAKENLIKARATHLDQLIDKLREERVRKVIEPMLKGEDMEKNMPWDDVQYSIDLGLIMRTPNGLVISNKIYNEVIPRELGFVTQVSFESTVDRLIYVNKNGSLNIEKLISDFQEFFRENSESWLERFMYKEAGPQLLLQAYLQRVVNGGGRIHREYGLGRMRTDLLVEWSDKSKYVIEMKVLHKSLESTIAEGLKQTWEYMDRTGMNIGNLLIFDKRKDVSWDEKIFRQEREYEGKKIAVWGM
jgi:hypothetical protein